MSTSNAIGVIHWTEVNRAVVPALKPLRAHHGATLGSGWGEAQPTLCLEQGLTPRGKAQRVDRGLRLRKEEDEGGFRGTGRALTEEMGPGFRQGAPGRHSLWWESQGAAGAP